MKGLIGALARKLGLKKEPALDEAALDRLREEHRLRCHHFRLLLGANNTALHVMAELEEALKGERPFGMGYLRNRCIRVCTSVRQLISHLSKLSGGKYEPLFDQHRQIQQKIQEILDSGGQESQGPLVLGLEEINLTHSGETGGKMATLAEASRQLSLPIPEGFVVTASGYNRFMQSNDLQAEIDRLIQSAEPESYDECLSASAAVQKLIISAPVPEDLELAILGRYARLRERIGSDARIALRSSALGEDMQETSFAGQYRSELNVSEDSLLRVYKEIVASKYGVTAMSYRLQRGIPDEGVAMCVGCMRVIEAEAGGVAYSRNPVAGRDDSVVISSVFGLPQAVVDGSSEADRFEAARADPPSLKSSRVAHKASRYVLDAAGVRKEPLDASQAAKPSIDEATVLRLARMALDIEKLFERPQDVEWALDREGVLYLLQCRPLQILQDVAAPAELETDTPGCLLQGGVTASPGAAAGPVHILRKDADALNCPERAVLVAAQASPRWAPLLSHAAGLVTGQGSETGHLANVAREFRIPAIFGLASALEGLADRGIVTVDADACRVYEGEVESLLAERSGPRNLMLGSPVYRKLEQIAPFIVPLHLLDNESPDFVPAKCTSLHDITRFGHEMAVSELYSGIRDIPFPEKSSKQLYHGRPMQYWVVDLEDGFIGEVKGKLVTVSQIASRPMLALWRGMTAIPLEGPPPLDTKGFLSVMMESMANPELDPSLASSFQVRNYFLISREYCSLQSRFGFHFCTVEAQVGEDEDANYVSFQFKGGAADLPRRISRALLLAELLEELDFRVDVKQDALFARLEGLPAEMMEQKLAAVGHLAMHTRQLDMIMGNAAECEAARERLRKELALFNTTESRMPEDSSAYGNPETSEAV